MLDDFQEGIAVAWALANREDKISIVHILQALREQSGSITARWFISDMAQQYYNAWKEVFPTTDPKYLWCAWHVDRAWRNGLRSTSTRQRNRRKFTPFERSHDVDRYRKVQSTSCKMPNLFSNSIFCFG